MGRKGYGIELNTDSFFKAVTGCSEVYKGRLRRMQQFNSVQRSVWRWSYMQYHHRTGSPNSLGIQGYAETDGMGCYCKLGQ
jgi:hypothetical protein